MDFLDVPGASGAQYRFRRATMAELPMTAGNVIAVVGVPAKRRFLLCGAARSLNRAAPQIEAALREARKAQVYIRLNIARAVREAEHADIVAAVCPEAELPDLG
ncbi:MAG: hypothetical protein EPO51_05095 [Phenylobacterium sp.]|uniref:hypothetical protein n=1 Tax=Phenylobacterium sp. TaxID=1871053 RepID=UPI00121D4698|nr:hypothetical protein [Phenylobacterium sp.]TAJ73380.1 MAG: hypothetical protein EPO51_05095 [Phenylobacterium sp.]